MLTRAGGQIDEESGAIDLPFPCIRGSCLGRIAGEAHRRVRTRHQNVLCLAWGHTSRRRVVALGSESTLGWDAYVILLTVNSVDRPWVNFETGAAWFSRKKCILVKAGGLTRAEIPLPLSAKRVYALDVVDDAKAVFRDLGLESQAVNELVAEVVSLLRQMQLAGEGEPSWEGLEFQGTFYAWAGPLLDLEDRKDVDYSPELLEQLKLRGRKPRLCNRGRLSDHFGKGLSQVFATDRKSWRRAVVRGKQLLLVGRLEDIEK